MLNKLLVFVILLSMGLALASASFNLGTYDMIKNYTNGEIIKGTFSMNFSNEGNSKFTSNFGGETSLLELLKKRTYLPGVNFTCFPSNCKEGFKESNPEIVKSIELKQKIKSGLVLEGKDIVIKNFTMHTASDASPTCLNQLSIDLFNDNERDFYNDNYLEEMCGAKNYGCFIDQDTTEAAITSSPYCEKITLPASPAYFLGAEVKKGAKNGQLKMELYDGKIDNFLASCILPENNLEVQETGCTVNYSSKIQFEAFVCISAASGTDYRIKTESSNVCGLQGKDLSQGFQLDYKIYAHAWKYGVINKELNAKLYAKLNNNANLITALQDYIDSIYQSQCDPNCIIPLAISGVAGQNVDFSNIRLEYDSLGASGKISDKLYDIEDINYTISSGSLNFKLEYLGITAPNTEGANKFELKFAGTTLFSSPVEISRGLNFDITPKAALVGQRVKFKIVFLKNITSSEWNFGDGTIINSDNDETSHRYTVGGNFTIGIKVIINYNQTSSKTFTIEAVSSKESANFLINEYNLRIKNLSDNIKSFPPALASEIEKLINLTEFSNTILKIKNESNQNYSKAIEDLIKLDVPYSVTVSNFGTLPFSIGFNNLDLSYVESITNMTLSDNEDLKLNIIDWMEENYEGLIYFEVISQFADSGKATPLLTNFKITLNPKTTTTTKNYLILNYPFEAINFIGSYSQKAAGAGTYIYLSGINEIDFFINGKIEAQDLGAYISPDNIEFITPNEINIFGKKYPIKTVIIALIILLFAFFVAYILLQEWYKRNYESHLFSNKDDLYNMINFIYNSRLSDLDNSEINSKLMGSGWSRERVNYAFKRIDGKRTGMFEIPIFRIFERRKVQREIAKRQQDPRCARFIKRPYL